MAGDLGFTFGKPDNWLKGPKNWLILLRIGSKVSGLAQFIPFLIHFSDDPARISHNQGVIRHILGNYGAGPDQGIFPDPHTANDGNIGADTGAPARRPP